MQKKMTCLGSATLLLLASADCVTRDGPACDAGDMWFGLGCGQISSRTEGPGAPAPPGLLHSFNKIRRFLSARFDEIMKR